MSLSKKDKRSMSTLLTGIPILKLFMNELKKKLKKDRFEIDLFVF